MKRTFIVEENTVHNLVEKYADSVLDMGEAETTEDFSHAQGFCYASELWMEVLGIDANSDFVQDIIKHRKGE